jgi:hypothetical protein
MGALSRGAGGVQLRNERGKTAYYTQKTAFVNVYYGEPGYTVNGSGPGGAVIDAWNPGRDAVPGLRFVPAVVEKA